MPNYYLHITAGHGRYDIEESYGSLDAAFVKIDARVAW